MRDDLARIVNEFERRDKDPNLLAKYSITNLGSLFIAQNHERALINRLRQHHLLPLPEPILDFGSGSGGILPLLVKLGADPKALYGCDVVEARIAQARQRVPANITLFVSDGTNLSVSYANHFSLIYVSMVFSSILDDQLRRAIADELWQALKPGGSLIWYDFYLKKPSQSEVRPVTKKDVQDLFPKAKCVFKRVTLLPPLAYMIAPRAWLLAQLLSTIPWLCSHELGVLSKKGEHNR